MQDNLVDQSANFASYPFSTPHFTFQPDRSPLPLPHATTSHLNFPPLPVLVATLSTVGAALLVALVTFGCLSLPSLEPTEGKVLDVLRRPT